MDKTEDLIKAGNRWSTAAYRASYDRLLSLRRGCCVWVRTTSTSTSTFRYVGKSR